MKTPAKKKPRPAKSPEASQTGQPAPRPLTNDDYRAILAMLRRARRAAERSFAA